MSDTHPTGGRSFERWALFGAAAMALAALAAFQLRRHAARPATDETPDPARLLEIEIGGERPPPAADRDGARNRRPAPLPTPRADPPPAPPDRPPATTRSVVVQPGETLGEIALRELGTSRRAHEIATLNGLPNADAIRAGDTLRLPPR